MSSTDDCDVFCETLDWVSQHWELLTIGVLGVLLILVVFCKCCWYCRILPARERAKGEREQKEQRKAGMPSSGRSVQSRSRLGNEPEEEEVRFKIAYDRARRRDPRGRDPAPIGSDMDADHSDDVEMQSVKGSKLSTERSSFSFSSHDDRPLAHHEYDNTPDSSKPNEVQSRPLSPSPSSSSSPKEAIISDVLDQEITHNSSSEPVDGDTEDAVSSLRAVSVSSSPSKQPSNSKSPHAAASKYLKDEDVNHLKRLRAKKKVRELIGSGYDRKKGSAQVKKRPTLDSSGNPVYYDRLTNKHQLERHTREENAKVPDTANPFLRMKSAENPMRSAKTEKPAAVCPADDLHDKDSTRKRLQELKAKNEEKQKQKPPNE
jgi:hypothetical protein